VKHGPLDLDFTVYGSDAERMSLGQDWPVKINGHVHSARVVRVRDDYGASATLRVKVTFETGSFPETIGTIIWDDEA
jgi:hypothetical protein